MNHKPRTVLYGGGDYCTKFLNESFIDQYEIIAIADRSFGMWGKRLCGILIVPPDELLKENYELLIITPGKWESIVESLLTEYKIERTKISLYEVMKHRVVNLVDDEGYINEHRQSKKEAIEEIKRNLILEAQMGGAFDGYNEIKVIGNESEYNSFSKIASEELHIAARILRETEKNVSEKDTLFVFTDADYCQNIDRLKNEGIVENNWLILPLFDVENSVLG